MGGYAARRILFALVTVFVAITLNFGLFRLLPGDALSALRCKNCTEAFKKAQRHDLGLDRSKGAQYLLYIEGLAHGRLGQSLRNEAPVRDELGEPIKNTVLLVLSGTIFSIIFGILQGVVSAWRRGTAVDRIGQATALAFYSMPTQWLALLIVLFVAGAVGLPTSGVADPTINILGDASTWAIFVDRVRHLILPSLTLGLVLYGDYSLIVRSAMLETLGEDYVLTARAKGLTNWRIVWRHGFRNALLPVVTLIALSLGFVIGGVYTIEYIFSYPGIGYLTVEAIDQRDYAVLQGIFLLITVSVILFNLAADLLYPKLDPRVTTA